MKNIKNFFEYLKENKIKLKLDNIAYDNFSLPDVIRMELIDIFFKNVKNDDNYNKSEPILFKLIDDWDGYDDQVYIQNNLEDGCIIFYEGWVKACWDAILKNVLYKDMSKKEVLENFLSNRMTKMSKELNLTIVDSEYFLYKGKYIMKIKMKI